MDFHSNLNPSSSYWATVMTPVWLPLAPIKHPQLSCCVCRVPCRTVSQANCPPLQHMQLARQDVLIHCIFTGNRGVLWISSSWFNTKRNAMNPIRRFQLYFIRNILDEANIQQQMWGHFVSPISPCGGQLCTEMEESYLKTNGNHMLSTNYSSCLRSNLHKNLLTYHRTESLISFCNNYHSWISWQNNPATEIAKKKQLIISLAHTSLSNSNWVTLLISWLTSKIPYPETMYSYKENISLSIPCRPIFLPLKSHTFFFYLNWYFPLTNSHFTSATPHVPFWTPLGNTEVPNDRPIGQEE